MIQILGYEDWQAAMLSEITLSTKIDCPECNGGGVIEKECECCGHEEEIDCEDCDGSGKVIWGEIDQKTQKKYLTKSRWVEAVIKDLVLYSEWMCEDKFALLLEYGFTSYSYIYNERVETILIEKIDIDLNRYWKSRRGIQFLNDLERANFIGSDIPNPTEFSGITP